MSNWRFPNGRRQYNKMRMTFDAGGQNGNDTPGTNHRQSQWTRTTNQNNHNKPIHATEQSDQDRVNALINESTTNSTTNDPFYNSRGANSPLQNHQTQYN